LLDSFALLAFLKRESGFEGVSNLLRSARARREPLLMNEVNIGEVYYSLAKSRSTARAEAFLQRLHTLPIRPVSNTLAQVLDAARLKARFPISYADAFAVATAQRENATLVTGDRELHTIEHLIPILWI
jgi:uncharacterized protein